MSRNLNVILVWLFSLVAALMFLSGCATRQESRSITLILPDSYTGDVFVVAGKESDVRCENELRVPASGIVFVSNFAEIGAVPRSSFRAKTISGHTVHSSLQVNAIGPKLLWPVVKLHDQLLYFVVGSLDDKIRLSANKEGNWPALAEHLRKSRK